MSAGPARSASNGRWLVLLLVAVGACSSGPERPGGSGASTRDSAGVTIREFPGPLPTNEVVLEPVWTHGHDAGDYEFQRVFQAVLQRGTAVVAADGGNDEVVMISPDGASFSVLARSGQGPEEVRGPGAVVRLGRDSVWVRDRGNSKLLLFVGGAPAVSVSTAGNAELSFNLMPIGVAPDGTLLLNTGAFRSDFEEPWLYGTLARLGPDGASADTVGTYPLMQRRQEPINPFAAYGQAISAGRSFVTSRTDVPELHWRRPDGSLFRIDRWRPEPVYPTAADFDDFIEAMRLSLARANPRMSGERLQEFLGEQVSRYALDRSVPMPYLRWMVGGDEGALWVAHRSDGGFWSASYTVLAPDLGPVGLADFGREVAVVDVSDEYVLAVVRDDYDVQALAVWRYRIVG